jgi:diguanylate cyclase (GGDEF)-like protein
LGDTADNTGDIGRLRAIEARIDIIVSLAINSPTAPIDAVLHEQVISGLATALIDWASEGPKDRTGLDKLNGAARDVCMAFTDSGDSVLMVSELVQQIISQAQLADADTVSRLFQGALIALSEGVRAHVALRLLHPLTQLPQLAAFESDLEDALENADAAGTGTRILFLDLDGLKQINDNEGHTQGDGAIRGLADAIQAEIPADGAQAYHIHGDEFLVIIKNLQSEEINRLVQGIRAEAFRTDGHGIRAPVSFSAGVATYPQDGRTVRELKDTADDRMQADKRRKGSGR